MALSRRSGQRMTGSIWPGFVDAMTALLLVLMFVLSIFMIVQSVLRDTITAQDTELDSLSAQIAGLADALGLEQSRSQALTRELGALGSALSEAQAQGAAQAALIATLSGQLTARETELAGATSRIADFEAQVASLLVERDAARDESARLAGVVAATEADLAAERDSGTQLAARIVDLEAAEAVLIDEQQALQLALARARTEIDEGVEAARLAAARREALEALVADLRADVAATEVSLTGALAQLQAETSERDRLADLLALSDGALSRAEAEAAAAALDAETVRARLAALAAELTEAERALLAEAATAALLRERLGETVAEAAARARDLDVAEAARLAELAAAEALRARLADAEGALSEEESARLAEAAAAEALRERLRNADAELTAMTLALEDQRRRAEETLTILAAAQAAGSDLDQRLAAALLERDKTAEELAALRDSVPQERAEIERQLAAALAARRAAEAEATRALSAAEERAILLATANRALEGQEARAADSARQVALLSEQVAALSSQLGSLQALLDDAAARDATSRVQIEALGGQLNTALAQVAAEQRRRADLEEAERRRLEAETQRLERFQSEFFGQLRDVLVGREGVRVVGDRFVFSSEVLFEPGSATLLEEGRAQIAGVAAILSEVAGQIPAGIDWILRVDGHTDNVPLSGRGQFADNWALSQARALSVVRFMQDELGFPPERMAATGFGEYRPVTEGSSIESRAQNRRIELKLTER